MPPSTTDPTPPARRRMAMAARRPHPGRHTHHSQPAPLSPRPQPCTMHYTHRYVTNLAGPAGWKQGTVHKSSSTPPQPVAVSTAPPNKGRAGTGAVGTAARTSPDTGAPAPSHGRRASSTIPCEPTHQPTATHTTLTQCSHVRQRGNENILFLHSKWQNVRAGESTGYVLLQRHDAVRPPEIQPEVGEAYRAELTLLPNSDSIKHIPPPGFQCHNSHKVRTASDAAPTHLRTSAHFFSAASISRLHVALVKSTSQHTPSKSIPMLNTKTHAPTNGRPCMVAAEQALGDVPWQNAALCSRPTVGTETWPAWCAAGQHKSKHNTQSPVISGCLPEQLVMVGDVEA